ncbi:MCP methyltransferase, CheR-type [Jannaschia faecimaris]|uniref:protein-glutamate O-methyltransferase n=2 Tax=Jannaschia faecimaris TaxID=1244108 RepID=A0A1H3QWS5_9RHOB|nr:MCP methyltransferase, CheR-type [Jannaschia faecimaris]
MRPGDVSTSDINYPTEREARVIVEVAHRAAGLHLDPRRIEFLHQRLARQVATMGQTKFSSYCRLLEMSGMGGAEIRSFVEALTTHTTSFFREQPHFDWLGRTGWADLIERGAGRDWPLVVWSAACSSGQELYSAMISLIEHSDEIGTPVRMEGLGTDISTRILQNARTAVYPRADVRGLDEARHRRFLMRAKDGSDRFRLTPELRNLCRWSYANLTNLVSDGPPQADVIMLRNVLIYFDPSTQVQVVDALVRRLLPGGILLTGHTESLRSRHSGLLAIGSSIYRKEF